MKRTLMILSLLTLSIPSLFAATAEVLKPENGDTAVTSAIIKEAEGKTSAEAASAFHKPELTLPQVIEIIKGELKRPKGPIAGLKLMDMALQLDAMQ